jgi:chromosome partitioning protein
MKTILVANAKGGAGKTTLATNIAGGLAARGAPVTLWDLDRQKSALQWLAVRPESLPGIAQLGDGRDDLAKPKGKGWLIIDSPAGLHGKTLARAIKLSHRVMVPVQPSLFDMAATSEFLRDLVAAFEDRGGAAGRVGIVGMRVDPRTRAAATLEAFLGQFGLPVLTYLRDTQIYANAAFSGASLFDLPAYLSARELAQWDPVFEWLSA